MQSTANLANHLRPAAMYAICNQLQIFPNSAQSYILAETPLWARDPYPARRTSPIGVRKMRGHDRSSVVRLRRVLRLRAGVVDLIRQPLGLRARAPAEASQLITTRGSVGKPLDDLLPRSASRAPRPSSGRDIARGSFDLAHPAGESIIRLGGLPRGQFGADIRDGASTITARPQHSTMFLVPGTVPKD